MHKKMFWPNITLANQAKSSNSKKKTSLGHSVRHQSRSKTDKKDSSKYFESLVFSIFVVSISNLPASICNIKTEVN